MPTLDLIAAAKMLGMHKNTLQARAKAGDVPGAKIGKEWRFIAVDLLAYVRAQYPANKNKGGPCRSIRAVKHGGSTFVTKAEEFDAALGLPTSGRRSAFMTNSRPNSGLKLVMDEHGKTPA